MMFYKEIQPVIDYSVRGLCRKPYHNHSKGCPNFNKREDCPPKVEMFEDYFSLREKFFIIWNEFDLASHLLRMKEKHPEWTIHQLRCCLYWQPQARKQLKKNIVQFMRENPDYKVVTCPEAMGVNITETFKQIGITLEWPPITTTYQVAIAGKLKKTL